MGRRGSAANRRCLPQVLVVLVLLTGCSAFGGPDTPEPVVTPSRLRDTMDIVSVGTVMTVTATVRSVLTATSFVVEDVDLPREGLLVLGDAAAGLRPADLVTVNGTVVLFRFADLAAPYGLTAEGPYAAFSGEKILEAREIRSWA